MIVKQGYNSQPFRVMKQKYMRQTPLRTFAGLVKAVNWYDVSLQSMLEDLNMSSVNRTQSMILVHISNGVTRPSDIAREMGTTRQNVHAMAKLLIENNIVTQIADPTDGRSKLYAFSTTRKAIELRETVLEMLSYLDRQLAERLGKAEIKEIRETLSKDWGTFVTKAPAKLQKKHAKPTKQAKR